MTNFQAETVLGSRPRSDQIRQIGNGFIPKQRDSKYCQKETPACGKSFQSRKGIAGSTTIVIAGSAANFAPSNILSNVRLSIWYVAALAARLALAVTPVCRYRTVGEPDSDRSVRGSAARKSHQSVGLNAPFPWSRLLLISLQFLIIVPQV